MASSINSGDLTGAQQAYSALSQLQSSGQGLSANPIFVALHCNQPELALQVLNLLLGT
jgi:hypothetical protein